MATILTGPSLSAIVASGSVYPSRFVKFDTTDYRIIQCVADDSVIGVSQEGARLPPTDENYVSGGVAFTVGHLVAIYGVGRNCLLELGSTVSVGDPLMPDASGKGVPATDGKNMGAFAKSAGVDGDLIQVSVNSAEVNI